MICKNQPPGTVRQMAIKLDIKTTDSETISLLQRYWATDEAGGFVEKVSALLPFREIKNSSGLASYIRTVCAAFDENQTCVKCGSNLTITSRSEAKKYPHHPVHPCVPCKAEMDEARRIAEEQAEAELRRRVFEHAANVEARTINYESVPDDLALIALALDQTISPRLIGGSFRYADCASLAPMYVDEFINRLWKGGVISDNPRAPGPMAYLVKGEGLSYYPNRISFSLVPDEFLGAGAEAFQELVVRTYNDKKGLLGLWFDYAMADCMAYLYDQCSDFNLVVPEHKIEEIKSTVHTALKFYSIAEVWCMIWRVVQKTSTNSNHRFSSKEKSAGTIPAKLLLQFESARKGKTAFTKWDRPKSLPAGMLGQVFNEIYGFDEKTDSSFIINMLSDDKPLDRSQVEANIDSRVQELMTAALSNGSGAAVMYDFSELINNGADISEAIEQLMEVYALSPKVVV